MNIAKSIILTIASISCFCTAHAQLEILETGTTILGERQNVSSALSPLITTPIPIDFNAQVVVLGNGSYNSCGRISFGEEDYVRIGEYGSTNSDILHLHGRSGLYYTSYGDEIYLFHTRNKGFQFYSAVTGTAFNIRSDARLKQNIKSINSDVWKRIYNTNPVSYNYIADVKTINDSNSSIKPEKESAKTAAPDGRLRYGFVSQEVKELFPDLVVIDEDGYESIDYMGFIPILVNAVKELKAEITSLNNSQKRIIASENIVNSEIADAWLAQNSPNPFSVSTKIECSVPVSISNAMVRIYDLQGKQVSRLNVEGRGKTFVSVEASTLYPGMYIYALICDGVEVDNKRMIVTE